MEKNGRIKSRVLVLSKILESNASKEGKKFKLVIQEEFESIENVILRLKD
jgi:DNA-binding TFAR19-related protein (PDSD5 family)